MKCPACGTRNNFYHRYCYFCGEKLGAMIDPPDHDNQPVGQEQEATARDTDLSTSTHDPDAGGAHQSQQESPGADVSKESYSAQENQQDDTIDDTFFEYKPEHPAPSRDTVQVGDNGTDTPISDALDYFGDSLQEHSTQPAELANDKESDPAATLSGDIDYFGHTSGSTSIQEEHAVQDTRGDIAAGMASEDDYFSPAPAAPGQPAEDSAASIEEDIAEKISSMEKYMDDYLSGRIGQSNDPVKQETDEKDNTPLYNDSLDFIHIEEEDSYQQRKPEPLPPVNQTPVPAPPAPAADTVDQPAQDISDPFEDEETSKMIDKLYQNDTSAQGTTYPRRAHRHTASKEAPVSDDRPEKSSGNVFLKVFISLIIIALMVFAGYVLYDEFLNPNKVPSTSETELAVNHILENETQDGVPGQLLTLYAQNGTSATLFGTAYSVENDKLQQFYTNDFLREQYDAAGDAAENNVLTTTAVVYNAEGKSVEYKIEFALTSPFVSLSLSNPQGDTIEVQGDTCTLEISVQPGARLYINDTEYTDQVGQDGLAVIDIAMSGSEEMPVHIRASMEGYQDAEASITLVPAQTEEESLLVLNESIPLATTATEVTLTGQVPPGAAIESSLTQVGAPVIDETGAFTMTVKIPGRPGYSVCVLQVSLDGTQVDQKEVIIERSSTFNEYTTGPWEFSPYSDYQISPDLHTGYRFEIPGKVKEVISQGGGKTVCTVDINPDGVEQLIRVWYWGDFSFTTGSSVIVYANRWGNEEGVPRLLARYIISN